MKIKDQNGNEVNVTSQSQFSNAGAYGIDERVLV
jgi:hypothetical protein